MDIENLTTLVTIVLAISLASERLVTIIKTMIPYLADEKKTDAQEIDLVADKGRRLWVQFIAFVCAWLTSTFLANNPGNYISSWYDFDGTNNFFESLFGFVNIGKPAISFPVIILGVQASGRLTF